MAAANSSSIYKGEQSPNPLWMGPKRNTGLFKKQEYRSMSRVDKEENF